MSDKDGGPAFPHERSNERFEYPAIYFPGMSLRDYFAIRAPEPTDAYINSQSEADRLANPHNDTYKPARRSRLEIIAQGKYAYADAMLKARAQ